MKEHQIPTINVLLHYCCVPSSTSSIDWSTVESAGVEKDTSRLKTGVGWPPPPVDLLVDSAEPVPLEGAVSLGNLRRSASGVDIPLITRPPLVGLLLEGVQ